MGGGGAERVVANIANSLSERRYEVKILTFVSNESFYQLNYNVDLKSAMLSINRSNKITRYISMVRNLLKVLFFIRSEIKKFKPDTVVSILKEADILTYYVKKTGVKFKHICSERNDPSRRNKFLQRLLVHIYKNSNHFVCQSSRVAEFYSEIPRDKVSIISNPLDISMIPESVQESHFNNIVAVGRLDSQKNFPLLIDSYYDVHDKLAPTTLTIYGEGPMRKEIEKQIKKYNLEEKVFLPGAQKNVLDKIKDASLFVMSSDYEGFPNALVEAMSVGLPVISTDFATGVAKELISDDNGIVVPVKDRDALGKAIEKIMNDSNMRRTMRSENKKIMKKVDLKSIMCEWERVL